MTAPPRQPRTLSQKIWDEHVVHSEEQEHRRREALVASGVPDAEADELLAQDGFAWQSLCGHDE